MEGVQADREGWTPLFVAAQEGQEAVAQALMEGVDVSQAKNDGATPLHGPPEDRTTPV